MLYREIIAVCSQIHTKHINTLCGQNVELLNFETRDLWSNHLTFSIFRLFPLRKNWSGILASDVSGLLNTDRCFHLATNARSCDVRGCSSSRLY